MRSREKNSSGFVNGDSCSGAISNENENRAGRNNKLRSPGLPKEEEMFCGFKSRPVRQFVCQKGLNLNFCELNFMKIIFKTKNILTYAMPIDLHHGSGSYFDKFKEQFIGAGEGGSAYGWGFYFSDGKEVAEHYSKALSGLRKDNGLMIEVDSVDEKFLKELISRFSGDAKRSYDELKRIEEWFKDSENQNKPIPGYSNQPSRLVYHHIAYLAEKLLYCNKIYGFDSDAGYLYKVIVFPKRDANSYALLKWESPVPLEIIQKVARFIDRDKIQTDSGKNLYMSILQVMRSKKQTSKFLLQCGIDGVQAESGVNVNSKTVNYNNFVIFDPNEIEIASVEKIGRYHE